MPVSDVTSSTSVSQRTAEAVSFTDGIAGTTQRIKLTYDGVMSLYGERIGMDGDSSLVFNTGSVLTTEVPWRYKNTEGKDNEADRLATLANGEFMVDYENGYILGKNFVTTSSSTDSVNYKVRLNASTVVGGGDASAANQLTQITAEQAIQTAVEIMDDWDENNRAKVNIIDGQEGVAAGVGATDAGTQRMVMATDSPDVTALQLIDDAIFTDDVDTFTPGTTKGINIGLVVDDVGTDTADEGDRTVQRGSARRAAYVTLDTDLAGEDHTNLAFATVRKLLAADTYSPNADVSAAAEAQSVSKASPGNLESFTATNSSVGPRYLQFFNSTSVPADTTVPVLSYFCASGGTISDNFQFLLYFSSGISWAWSSTAATKTVGGADGIANVRTK